jgi:hypothetical protein
MIVKDLLSRIGPAFAVRFPFNLRDNSYRTIARFNYFGWRFCNRLSY